MKKEIKNNFLSVRRKLMRESIVAWICQNQATITIPFDFSMLNGRVNVYIPESLLAFSESTPKVIDEVFHTLLVAKFSRNIVSANTVEKLIKYHLSRMSTLATTTDVYEKLKHNLLFLVMETISLVASNYCELKHKGSTSSSLKRIEEISRINQIPTSLFRSKIQQANAALSKEGGASFLFATFFPDLSKRELLDLYDRTKKRETEPLETMIKSFQSVRYDFRLITPFADFVIDTANESLQVKNGDTVSESEFSNPNLINSNAYRAIFHDLPEVSINSNPLIRKLHYKMLAHEYSQSTSLPVFNNKEDLRSQLPIFAVGSEKIFSVPRTDRIDLFGTIKNHIEFGRTYSVQTQNRDLIYLEHGRNDNEKTDSDKEQCPGTFVLAIDSSSSTTNFFEHIAVAGFVVSQTLERIDKKQRPEMVCVNFSAVTIISDQYKNNAEEVLSTFQGQGTTLDIQRVMKQVSGENINILIITDCELDFNEISAALQSSRVKALFVFELNQHQHESSTLKSFKEQAKVSYQKIDPSKANLVACVDNLVKQLYNRELQSKKKHSNTNVIIKTT